MFFRKKENLEEQKLVKKKEEPEIEWDKKKILLTLFFGAVAILAAIEVKNRFFPNTSILGESTVKKTSEIDKPSVKAPNIDVESKFGDSINEIKNNINNLDAQEIASSSPQIQKVLRDIQGIRDLPADQARNTCLKICSGI